MSTSDDRTMADRLGALADELFELDPVEEHPDPLHLARRHGLEEAEVVRALAAWRDLDAVLRADPVTLSGALVEHFEEDEFLRPQLGEDFELGEELGRGGMGVVWRARQKSLDREVAVKVLAPGEMVFGRSLRRFQKEARSLAKLRHPHIVRIHEVGEGGGTVWFTMDLIEGKPLSEVLRKGEMTPSQAVRVMKQVASAVAYVHRHGFIHRDLKPQNILIDESGDAFVTDFGLAREIEASESTLTQGGGILGTPAYMSPEQARGDLDAVGEGTDVHALGAVLFECLTGSAPYRAGSPAELLHAVIHQPPPALPRRKGIPHDLGLIARKALSKNPEDRYPTANAFLEDLERFDEGRPVRAEAPTLAKQGIALVMRHRALTAVALATFVATVLVFLFVIIPAVERDRSLNRARAYYEEGHLVPAAGLYLEHLDGLEWKEARRATNRVAGVLLEIGPREALERRAREHLARVEGCLEVGLRVRAIEGERELTRKEDLLRRSARKWSEFSALKAEALITRAVVESVDLNGELGRLDLMSRSAAVPAIMGSTTLDPTPDAGVARTLLRWLDREELAIHDQLVEALLSLSRSLEAAPLIAQWLSTPPEKTADRIESIVRVMGPLLASGRHGLYQGSSSVDCLLLAAAQGAKGAAIFRALVEDASLPDASRDLAAFLLAAHGGLPARFIWENAEEDSNAYELPSWEPFGHPQFTDASRTRLLALEEATRTLQGKDRWRALVREELEANDETDWLEDWIPFERSKDWTAMQQARQWFGRYGEEDPVITLFPRLALQGVPALEAGLGRYVGRLAAGLVALDGATASQLHAWLSLRFPEARVVAPSHQGHRLLSWRQWAEHLEAEGIGVGTFLSEDDLICLVATFPSDGDGWGARATEVLFRPLDEAESVGMTVQRTREQAHEQPLTWRVPGLTPAWVRYRTSEKDRLHVQLRVRRSEDDDLQIRISRQEMERSGPGFTSSSGGSGPDRIRPGDVVTLDALVREDGAESLALMTVVPRQERGAASDLDWWRQRLREQLDDLRKTVDQSGANPQRIRGVHGRSDVNLRTLCFLPMTTDRKRVEAALRGHERIWGRLSDANGVRLGLLRLIQGLVTDPDEVEELVSALGARSASRVLRLAADEEVQAAALRRLKALVSRGDVDARSAWSGLLVEGILPRDEGRALLQEGLRGNTPLQAKVASAVLILGFPLLVLLLNIRRLRKVHARRLVAGAMLATLVLAVCVRIDGGGVDFTDDRIAMALLALLAGAMSLRTSGGLAIWFGLTFGCAAACESWAMLSDDWLRISLLERGANLAFAFGVLALPLLGARWTRGPVESEKEAMLRAFAPTFSAKVMVLALLVTTVTASPSPWLLLGLGLLFLGVAKRRENARASVNEAKAAGRMLIWPTPFVVAYGLPVLFFTMTLCGWFLTTGGLEQEEPLIHLGGFIYVVAAVSTSIALAWAALRPFTAVLDHRTRPPRGLAGAPVPADSIGPNGRAGDHLAAAVTPRREREDG